MQLLLRILAGPNAGGEMLLADGECVIGSGDSCDVVLADGAVAERHLALDIAGAEVKAKLLGGSVFLAGDVFYGGVLDYFAPLNLGATHLAVGPAGSAWPRISLVSPTELANADAQNFADAVGISEDAARSSGVAEDDAAVSVDDNSTKNKTFSEDSVVRDKKAFLMGGIGVVILALILLFAVRSYNPKPTELAVTDATIAESVTQLIQGLGFKEIEVQVNNGRATLKGYVPSREDRRKLSRETRKAGHPVRVRVRDGEALSEGLRESLAMAGLNMGVSYAGRGRLAVQGYAADRDTVRAALEIALRDVPGVLGVELNLLTARDAVNELVAAARKQGLDRRVAISAYPGYILAQGRLSDAQLDAWTRAKEPVMRRYGGHVDLRENFSGVRRAPRSTGTSNLVAQSLKRVGVELNLPPKEGGAALQPVAVSAGAPVLVSPGAAASGPVGPRLDVQSVSLGAARFMTLQNGKRYFEGGRLPGGYVIREIQADRIVLTKGTTTATHRIGGN